MKLKSFLATVMSTFILGSNSSAINTPLEFRLPPSAFKPVPHRYYNILTSSDDITFFNYHISPFEYHKYEQYKSKLEEGVISPDKITKRSTSKFGRYKSRCKCLICGWTGCPDRNGHYMLKCEGCSNCVYKSRVKNHKEECMVLCPEKEECMVLCPEGELIGLELNKTHDSAHIHNGFICDKQLVPKDFSGSTRLQALESLKSSNAPVWFYCYSCKACFLVPINDIQHPPCVFEH